MSRTLAAFALLALIACGGSGSETPEDPAPPPVPALLSVDVALDGLNGTAFELHGEDLPGLAGATYPVRFIATDPIFDDCTGTELTGTVEWISSGVLRGTVPPTHVLADARTRVTVELPGGPVSSATAIATFLGTPDAIQDQDGNGLRDGCDPNTYDFESDAVGATPTDTTHLGLPAGLVVADVGGDQVARFSGTNTGSHDRLDRVVADYPQQDTTVYVDWDDTDSVGSIELWSEGSYSDFAGAGLIVQIRSGLIHFFERLWRSVPVVVGPALPANGRMRIRVRKGPGTTSTVHVDAWNGAGWDADHAVFPIADDTDYRGRNTVLAEYSGGIRGIKRITVVPEIPAAPLTVAQVPGGLAPWRLFQRDVDNGATIPVRALYRLAQPGRLEARVVRGDNGLPLPGHDFADHGMPLAAADGARAALDLPGVPTGGNYDVHIRLLDESGGVVSQVGVGDVAVGDVYVCAGQSNMSGYSGVLTGATAPIPQAHRLHNDGRWAQAVEPCDDGTGQLDAVSREFPLHSLMLPFAKSLYEATDVPVAVVPCSLGGSSLYIRWQRNATTPFWRATLYGSMIHRARIALGGKPPAGFLWFQGESDVSRTDAQYLADFNQFVDQVRTDLGAPTLLFITAQLGTFAAANFATWTRLQEAQRRAARGDPDVALVTTVDAPRSDGIHFNVPGYQTIGHRFAQAARALRFGHAIDPLTELVSVAPGTAADRIDLTYDADVSGGDATLYAVTDDAGAATVSSIEVSGAVVTLVLDRALSTNATVQYGRSVLPTANWVVDAAGVPVPCFHEVPVSP